jgi:restriction system protein
LIQKTGISYKSTDLGRNYLQELRGDGSSETKREREIHRLIANHHENVRGEIRQLLISMDPFQFEELIKTLLATIGYEDVEVTSPTNDGGVDVIAHIQLGISNVKEVVQVKRYSKNVQRKTLDALRGSLHRFQAVRGTIITTSDFSKGTKGAAFENGAVPITLINGDRLIDLLIENELGVRSGLPPFSVPVVMRVRVG